MPSATATPNQLGTTGLSSSYSIVVTRIDTDSNSSGPFNALPVTGSTSEPGLTRSLVTVWVPVPRCRPDTAGSVTFFTAYSPLGGRGGKSDDEELELLLEDSDDTNDDDDDDGESRDGEDESDDEGCDDELRPVVWLLVADEEAGVGVGPALTLELSPLIPALDELPSSGRTAPGEEVEEELDDGCCCRSGGGSTTGDASTASSQVQSLSQAQPQLFPGYGGYGGYGAYGAYGGYGG